MLRRVEAGEDVTITVNGRPVAILRPVTSGSPWMPRAEFLRRFAGAQTDPGLTAELAELAPDSTDDHPL